MNNSYALAILAFTAMALIGFASIFPEITSDQNEFLRGFVNHEFLNILGVIVAITAASASNVHLELRRMEAEYKFPNGFESTRLEVRRGAYFLLVLFLAALALVIAKPIIAKSVNAQSFFNIAAIFIIIWNTLILRALLGLSFKVGPISMDDDDDEK